MTAEEIKKRVNLELRLLSEQQEFVEDLLTEEEFKDLCDHSSSIAHYLRIIKNSVKEKGVE